MTETRTRRDAERTTADLLQAAQEEFASHGFAGARVDRIANRAGCNKSLIFQRFGDKRGLYHAVFRVIQSRWSPADEQLGALLDVTTRAGFVATIERLVGMSIDVLVAEPSAGRIMWWEIASGWANFGGDDCREPELAPIRDFLVQAERSGFLRPDLSTEAQLSLVTQVPLVMGAMRMDLADPAVRSFVSDFVVSGLVVPQSPKELPC